MKIIKYEHSCMVVENNGASLVVDPGEFTTDLVIPDDVVGIVITHEHADHLGHSSLRAIIAKNPRAVIVAHPDVAAHLDDYTTHPVIANEQITLGNFDLEFFGGQHATIFRDTPPLANLGVLINERLYYPGDSFSLPNRTVEVLALPVGAPWLKINETIEFLTAVKPKLAFPTHDAVLSQIGKNLIDRMISPIAQEIGAEYRRLHSPLEV